jgi:CHASE2 domain-containing sensor protein
MTRQRLPLPGEPTIRRRWYPLFVACLTTAFFSALGFIVTTVAMPNSNVSLVFALVAIGAGVLTFAAAAVRDFIVRHSL